MKTLANKNVEFELLTRYSGDPALQVLLKHRQTIFHNGLRADKLANTAKELGESMCIQRVIRAIMQRETQEGARVNVLPLKKQDHLAQTPLEVANTFNNFSLVFFYWCYSPRPQDSALSQIPLTHPSLFFIQTLGSRTGHPVSEEQTFGWTR